MCLCGHEKGSVLGVFYPPFQIRESPKCFFFFFNQPSSFMLSVTGLWAVYLCSYVPGYCLVIGRW